MVILRSILLPIASERRRETSVVRRHPTRLTIEFGATSWCNPLGPYLEQNMYPESKKNLQLQPAGTCPVVCRPREPVPLFFSVQYATHVQHELHQPGGAKIATHLLRCGRQGSGSQRRNLSRYVARYAPPGDRPHLFWGQAPRGDRLPAALRRRHVQITVSPEFSRKRL